MTILDQKEINLTPLFIVGNTVVLLITLIFVIIINGKVGQIVSTKAPTLVELADGSSLRVRPIGNSERTSQAISDFVGKTMVGLMSWNAVEQTPTKKLDEGIQAGEHRITTNAWKNGFALSEDFRASFLKELGTLTPVSIFGGKSQSILVVRHLSEPIKVNNGEWKQDMVANLVIFDSDQIGKAIAFNKTIYVRAIDTPPLSSNASDLQRVEYEARKAGLEIYRIQDLN